MPSRVQQKGENAMSTAPENLHLSKKEHKIVKSISRRKYKREIIDKNHKYQFLKYYHLIDFSDFSHKHYVLNYRGKSYLRFQAKDNGRFLVTTVIAVIALLLSLASIVISVISLKASLSP